MSDLHALAERLKKAAGADPELDALLLLHFAAPAGAYIEQSELNGNWCIYIKNYAGKSKLWEPPREWWRPDRWPLTSSIDAAVALCERVLPGWRIGVERQVNAENGWTAWVQILWGPQDARRWYGIAPTPALALCLAVVRAKIDATDQERIGDE